MKRFLIIAVLLTACGKANQHNHSGDAVTSASASEVLDMKVMEIHDELMPKMEDIYNLKKKIQDTISSHPKMAAARKASLELVVSELDSARDAMMDWMHKYDPKTDSADQEKSRVYLENQIEIITKLKDRTYEIIEKAHMKVPYPGSDD